MLRSRHFGCLQRPTAPLSPCSGPVISVACSALQPRSRACRKILWDSQVLLQEGGGGGVSDARDDAVMRVAAVADAGLIAAARVSTVGGTLVERRCLPRRSESSSPSRHAAVCNTVSLSGKAAVRIDGEVERGWLCRRCAAVAKDILVALDLETPSIIFWVRARMFVYFCMPFFAALGRFRKYL